MNKKEMTLVDVADMMERIKDQEQHRAEGVTLFRDCLVVLDAISMESTVAEKTAILNITVDALDEYLKNIVEYNARQDHLLDRLIELSEVEDLAS